MSRVELRERVRDSPLRARSLLTVRAAISSARLSDAPCSFSLFLMCSYWRARFVPFWTRRGGFRDLLRRDPCVRLHGLRNAASAHAPPQRDEGRDAHDQ